MRNRALVVVGVSLTVAVAIVTAQSGLPRTQPGVDATLFKGLRYRLVGPSRGGRVTTVTGVPSQPKTFYMGVASGGLFRTSDGGASWVPLTDGQVPLGSTGAIAVADSDPRVLYLGTGSDDVRSNVSTGRGVYKSSDEGKTWTFVGLHDTGQIGGIRIHPTNPNTLWVAAQGDAFKNNTERGVFKSTDGGAAWKKVLFVSDSIGAMDVELQPGNGCVGDLHRWDLHLGPPPSPHREIPLDRRAISHAMARRAGSASP